MQILHQERSGAWFDSRFVAPYINQLSPEAFDLLNHMLVDAEERIDLAGLNAHPWMRKPLPPHLEAARRRIRHSQLMLERRLATLVPDHDLVHQRTSRVYDLVREAAVGPEHWEQSHERLVQACRSLSLADCSSLPQAVRLNMRPEAVARRLSESALSLLDSPLEASPPGTPTRFSLPLHPIASDVSLSSMMPKGGDIPSTPASSELQQAGISKGGASAGGSNGDGEGLRQLSPFLATPTEPSGAP